jgi:hypothetical protein
MSLIVLNNVQYTRFLNQDRYLGSIVGGLYISWKHTESLSNQGLLLLWNCVSYITVVLEIKLSSLW